jgi:O-methyltransferase
VIIFGAGSGGKQLAMKILNGNSNVEVVAYADNDPKLRGTVISDKPVVHPSQIAEIDYDRIIIATMDTHNITKQLVDECGVKPDVIDNTLYHDLDFTNNGPRIKALKNSAQLIYDNGVAGSVAELGVFQGEFAKHINELFFDRTFYMFDTFEGFIGSDIEKEMEIGTKRMFERTYNYSGTSIELVMGKMKNPDRCIVKKGFFPETAEGVEDKFAFVSLDADLYQPMLEGLKYFYPKLSTGGIIFVHDFFTNEFTGTRKAVLEYKNDVNLKFIPLGDDCSVAIIK